MSWKITSAARCFYPARRAARANTRQRLRKQAHAYPLKQSVWKEPRCFPRIRCGQARRLTRGDVFRWAASIRCCKNSSAPTSRKAMWIPGPCLSLWIYSILHQRLNSLHEIATNPSGFFGLAGGDKRKDEAKGNGGAGSNAPENNNSKAAEQVLRELRNDPVGFLLNGFREMLSSPSPSTPQKCCTRAVEGLLFQY